MRERKTILFGGLLFAVLLVTGVVWLASGNGAEAYGSGPSLALSESGQEGVQGERNAWSEGDPLEATVYKAPTCGCCGAWVEHLEEHGFAVEVRDRQDMNTVKESFGVPRPLASCHTALVNGYLIEGHVPADDIKRFLEEPPEEARGLTVPAMPVGSPGMEMGDRVDPYNVLVMNEDGRTTVFARYGSQ